MRREIHIISTGQEGRQGVRFREEIREARVKRQTKGKRQGKD